MENDLTLLGYSFLWFVGYLLYIGVLPSISDSFYKNKSNILFTLFTWNLAIPLVLIGRTPILIIGCILICLVGISPNFKNKFDKRFTEKMHYYSALGGMGLALASMMLEFNMWILPITTIIAAFVAYKVKLPNKLYWIEMACCMNVYVGLLINILR